MKSEPLLLKRYIFFLLLLFISAAWSNVAAQSARVWTDKLDYAPGEVAIISGSGWQPGEEVELELYSTNLAVYEFFTVLADSEGNFTGLTYDILEIHLGEKFVLRAWGPISGYSPEWHFTDGNVTFESTGIPIPVTVSYRFTSPPPGTGTVITGTGNTEFTIAARNSTDVNFTYPTSMPHGTETIYGLTNVTINTGSLSTPGDHGYAYKFNSPSGARTIRGFYAICLSITQQPVAQSVAYGQNATFSVSATGATSFQWQLNTGTGFVNISGANASTLAILQPTVAMSGHQYRVAVTGACGTLTSSAVSLTVSPRAINVTADAKTKVYGGVDPALTYQFTPYSCIGCR